MLKPRSCSCSNTMLNCYPPTHPNIYAVRGKPNSNIRNKTSLLIEEKTLLREKKHNIYYIKKLSKWKCTMSTIINVS